MTAEWVYVNGKFVPRERALLDLSDAAITSGVMVSDFCRTREGKFFRPDRHRERFRANCQRLGIPLLASDGELRQVGQELIERNQRPQGELTLISLATPGNLLGPTLILQTRPFDHHRYQLFQSEGVILVGAGCHGALNDIVPASVKHRNRLAWHLAQQADLRHVPVLFVGGQADAPVGAILAISQGVVFRAPAGSVLESVSLGVVRELCQQLGHPFEETTLDEDFLTRADEILITGSGIDLVHVAAYKRLDGKIQTYSSSQFHQDFYSHWPAQ